jgi:hypothetical protein
MDWDKSGLSKQYKGDFAARGVRQALTFHVTATATRDQLEAHGAGYFFSVLQFLFCETHRKLTNCMLNISDPTRSQ